MTRTVLITGASNGIGRALALRYAGERARLVLVARNVQRLASVAEECHRRGALEVVTSAIDVRDGPALSAFIEQSDAAMPIDIAIANAGMSGGRPEGAAIEPAANSVALIETNVVGVLNTIQPLLPAMIGRRRGQIGIIGSLAGLIALPDSPSYCASKAAVLSYGQALRGLLAEHGVGVTVICAGYVETDMSQRVAGWKPGLITADRAAAIIARSLARNRGVISFPRTLATLCRLGALLPGWLRAPFLAAFRFTVAPPPS